MNFVSANASVGTYDPVSGIWDVGLLVETTYPGAPAELITAASLDIVTQVQSIPAPITNFAQIQTGYDIDATPGNDTDNTPDEDDESAVSVLPGSMGNTIDLELAMTGPSSVTIYTTTFLELTIFNQGSHHRYRA